MSTEQTPATKKAMDRFGYATYELKKATDRFGYATYEFAETWDRCEADTREEAIAYAFGQAEDAPAVFVCDQRAVDKLTPLVEAADFDWLMERAEEWAGENGHGTWYEDNIYDHSKEAEAALTDLLREAFSAWLAQYPGPRVWEAVNQTKHVAGERARTVADVQEARSE